MALASSHMSRKEKKLLELFQKRPSCLTIDNEEINHGAYGVVVKGSYDKRPVAIKKIHKTLLEAAITNEEIDRLIKSFKEEADMLRSINHPHVVTYFGAFYDPVTREPILVMELMSMNLREYLKKKKGALKTPKQIHICLQIALGLQFFHHMTPPLAHRDLNDKNVLLAEDGTVKIGDLGQSKYKVRKDIYFGTPVPGCFHFMAPETANREDSDKAHYTESVDIFALGVLTMEIATQSGPNPTICGFGILPEVGRRAEDIKKLGDTHPLKPLVLKCLENNYKKRPVIVQIVDELAHLIVHDYTENLQLSRQLEQMKADLSKQKDKKLALVRRVDELSKETSVRRSQQEWLQKQLMDSSNEKAQLNARIEDLKKDVTQKNQEKQHLEKDISQIRQDMEKQKTRVAQFEKSLFERDKLVIMLRGEVDFQTQELKEFEETHRKLSKENNILRETVQQLRAENKHLSTPTKPGKANPTTPRSSGADTKNIILSCSSSRGKVGGLRKKATSPNVNLQGEHPCSSSQRDDKADRTSVKDQKLGTYQASLSGGKPSAPASVAPKSRVPAQPQNTAVKRQQFSPESQQAQTQATGTLGILSRPTPSHTRDTNLRPTAIVCAPHSRHYGRSKTAHPLICDKCKKNFPNTFSYKQHRFDSSCI